MKVYMVLLDWSTTDDEAVEVEMFDSYKKAFDRFNEIIANEKNPDLSWVGAEAIDENGEIKDGYEFDEHIETDGTQEFTCWWDITDKNDWYRHNFLEAKDVQ